jgi:CRISPR-associated protein Cas1
MIMQTIILEDFGVFLGKKSERFVIKKKGKTLAEYPASQVERIIVSSSGASLSSSALYLAVTNRIPVSFTYSSGRPFGFLTPTLSHGTVLTRRAQYEQSGTLVATNLAKGFILGKLSNQKGLLKGWAKSRTRTDINLANRLFDLANDLDQAIEKIEIVDGALDDITRLTIMNIEGIAAASYWKGVSMILPTELGFESRVTRGATDSFNMLLNYGLFRSMVCSINSGSGPICWVLTCGQTWKAFTGS